MDDEKEEGPSSTGGGTDVTGYVFYVLLLPWAFSLASSFVRDSRFDLWPVLAGLVLFQACNSLIYWRSPSLFDRLAPSSLPLFTNTGVSLIHSTVVGVSVAGILTREWCRNGLASSFDHEKLFWGAWPGARAILCFSSGYFVYDQIDMLRRRLYNPRSPSLLAHHALLLLCFTMALYRRVTINYLILTLFCELHSIFLHLRRVLRMAGIRKEGSWLVKVEWSFNWFTFLTTRIVTHVLITSKLVLDASKFPAGIEWPLAIAGMAGLNVLNIVLGLDLLHAFTKERTIWRKQEKTS